MNRFFSKFITRFLLRTPLTPNQITFLSLLFGVLTGFLFSQGTFHAAFWGAFCFQIAAILDNCDGDIARAKNMKSEFGGWLDVVADLIADYTLFGGLFIAVYFHHQGPWKYAPLAALLCFLGAAVNFIIVVWQKQKGFGPAVFNRPTPEDKPRGWFMNTLDHVREGDSSWLLMAFVLLGWTPYLLYWGALYVQILWISGVAFNFKWMLNPICHSERSEESCLKEKILRQKAPQDDLRS